MKNRYTLVGAGVALMIGYVLGVDEGQTPGATDQKLGTGRELVATAGGHTVGAANDIRAIAGPALADISGSISGAVTPEEGGGLLTVPTVPPGGGE